MSVIQEKKRKSICIVLVTIIFRETILTVKKFFFIKAGCKTCKQRIVSPENLNNEQGFIYTSYVQLLMAINIFLNTKFNTKQLGK